MSWKEQLWSLLIDGKFEEANELRLSKLPQELYRYRPIASLKDFEYRKLELLGNIYFSDLRGVNDPFDSRFMTRDSGGKAADAMNCAFYPENRGIYTQSDSPKKSSRNIWSLAVVSVDQRY